MLALLRCQMEQLVVFIITVIFPYVGMQQTKFTPSRISQKDFDNRDYLVVGQGYRDSLECDYHLFTTTKDLFRGPIDPNCSFHSTPRTWVRKRTPIERKSYWLYFWRSRRWKMSARSCSCTIYKNLSEKGMMVSVFVYELRELPESYHLLSWPNSQTDSMVYTAFVPTAAGNIILWKPAIGDS
jgi:hypothetical protein